ncbi:aldo/keto reductase [Parabacteroides sp. OttesenSCG-928-G21]|nr:aldo/keto reductase [Parabacteroides sp. OttesenSCG-928-G21]
MTKINRRKFIQTGVVGVAGFTLLGSGVVTTGCTPKEPIIGKVKLGKTGLNVSRVAMGTGTVGYNKGSNQTRLGMEKFVEIAQRAYERGMRFFDSADTYGSVPYVAEAMKSYPRENITFLTKLWTYEDGSERNEPVDKILDRLRLEGNTDYFDIVLMHCMRNGNWVNDRTHYIDGLAKAKQDGIIKAVGVSCHSWDAMVAAVDHPWVDVIMARLNPFEAKMDGTTNDVNDLLAKARANGKGVVGMKIFGEGTKITEEEREKSIRYALKESNMDSMTLGLESVEQLDDAVDRILRIQKEK